MSLADDIESMYNHTKEVYDAILTLGGTLPEDKNLVNLVDTFDTIPLKLPYDPENPTLDGFYNAIQAGDWSAFPVGTEIPDEYNGQSNPLIVAQYLNSSNNSRYGGAVGAILIRKYVEPTAQVFGSDVGYGTSTIKTFLDTTYYNNSSTTLKSLISDINIPCYNGAGVISVTSKWFLMSAYEICNQGNSGTAGYEGIMWDYWKQKTGLSAPDNVGNNNSGRIMKNRSGTAQVIWLRSRYHSNVVCAVNTAGAVSYNLPSTSLGVLPACFIPGNESTANASTNAKSYYVRNTYLA